MKHIEPVESGETQLCLEGRRISSYTQDHDGLPFVNDPALRQRLEFKRAFDDGLSSLDAALRNESDGEISDGRVIVPPFSGGTDSKGFSETVTIFQVPSNQQFTDLPRTNRGRRQQYQNAAERQRAYRERRRQAIAA